MFERGCNAIFLVYQDLMNAPQLGKYLEKSGNFALTRGEEPYVTKVI